MRALVISILSLGLLLISWFYFYHYSYQTLNQLIFTCENEITPAIEEEDWQSAYQNISEQYKQWQNYEKSALYMLETDAINKTNESFIKTMMYIKAEDYSNSSGELLSLQASLKNLYESEAIKLKNIL